MSMYNILFGKNPLSDKILEVLDLKQEDFGRFRDCYVVKQTDGSCVIVVYTRNGGMNRKHWSNREENDQCKCPGCIITKHMPNHPMYLFDSDDNFDNTYAYIFFKIPEQHKKELSCFAVSNPKDVGTSFQELISAMKNNEDTPQVRNAIEVGKKIFKEIEEVIK